MEHRAELAKCYCRRREHWIQNNELLMRALMHIRPTFELWPPEFPRESIQRNPEKVMELTAPDQQMLSKFAQKMELVWDSNLFVEDPLREHKEFKGRVLWTDADKDIFVREYVRRPKKFAMIAKNLPGKSVGEVIEFYYQNRYTLSLKERELAFRPGGKPRVISEGLIKKD
jgi:hypothetical protein